MKKMIMVAVVMLIGSSAFAKNPHPVKVVSKQKDVVYFKVSECMIDASMKIFDSNGNLIYSEVVHSKRTIVDFYAEPSGTYKIELWKNGKEEVISYDKNSESHAESESRNQIVVAQL